ncbi:hypothetical protein [Alistipes communis]|uniref:hypothetical protein n=1 Tax=Alistipes communis TaxID=2585118 RepID=UPI00241D6D84|nr:hypothetical protein [Alistipes communis]
MRYEPQNQRSMLRRLRTASPRARYSMVNDGCSARPNDDICVSICTASPSMSQMGSSSSPTVEPCCPST